MALTRLFVHPIEQLLLVEKNVRWQHTEIIQNLVQTGRGGSSLAGLARCSRWLEARLEVLPSFGS